MNNLAEALNFRGADEEAAINALEGLFMVYFESNAPELKQEYVISRLISLINRLELDTPLDLLPSTQRDYPQQQVLLTKALVYLIQTYGIDAQFHVNRHALGILKDPRILNLAHENNHELIYQINRVINERKEVAEIEVTKNRYRHYLSDNLKNQQNIEVRTKSLARFLYYIEHPLEEQEMQKALNDLLEDFSGSEDTVILHTYMAYGKRDWHLLNTIYTHYRKQNPLGVEEFIARLQRIKSKYRNATEEKYRNRFNQIDNLIEDMKLVDRTHVATEIKTINQSRWMALGGFAFGMEIAMLALENIALMSSLGPWAILGISIGACLVFGPMIAIYFHTAHYDELKKQNQLEYFEKYRPNQEHHATSWGERIARIGTFEEGVAAGTLLLTLGAFVGLDIVSWGVKGGAYNSALPGFYFVNEVLMNCHWGWSILAVAAIATIAYSAFQASCALASAHYALDGKHTVEFFDKATEEAEMRNVINQETVNPLFFSRTLKWRHDFDAAVDEFKSDYFPPAAPRFADI